MVGRLRVTTAVSIIQETVYCLGNKALRVSSIWKSFFSIVLISLLKSEEIHLALWRWPVMHFLFHFLGISDFQHLTPI